MKAFIAVSFSKSKLLEKEINAIVNLLEAFNISAIVFVVKYKFGLTEELQIMEQSMKAFGCAKNVFKICVENKYYNNISIG